MRTLHPTGNLLAALLCLVPAALLACAPRDAQEEPETGDTGTAYEAPAATEEAPVTAAQADRKWDWEWSPYSEVDLDADDRVTDVEFADGVVAVYDTWDADDDTKVTWSEFETAAWGWWDVDDNDLIDEDEWNAVTTTWTFDDFTWDPWTAVDTDGDGHLGQTEFQELFNEEAWNGIWDVDGDGVVGPDEMADTFWDLFDGNDDNMIDEKEWDDWVA